MTGSETAKPAALVWDDARDEITALFQGRTPFNTDEESAILHVWKDTPAHVMELAARAAHAYAAGTVRYPWAWLAKACQEQPKRKPSGTANPILELDAAEVKAGQWMRVSGVHYDRWEEVYDELFGDRGLLRPWASDESLVESWQHEWEQIRPLGLALDAELEARATAWRNSPPGKQWSGITPPRKRNNGDSPVDVLDVLREV